VSGLPILVHGASVTAVIVGGGAVAARKAEALLACGARVRVIAPELAPALRATAAAGPRLTLVERAYQSGDLGDAELVFAATSSRAVNLAVAADARALHRLVSVADGGDDGSFGGMAVHRAGDVVVAVSAGGVPAAALRIRDAVAALVGPAFGDAVSALGALRQRMLRDGERARWRAASAELLGPTFCDDVRAGRLVARVAEWR
jgi:precorrin-2 dehydrogenase/sirohydrochlorin ferrochelatase